MADESVKNAAENDMTVRFTFDADKGLKKSEDLHGKLKEIYATIEKSNAVIDTTASFLWKVGKTMSKIYLLWRALPSIISAVKGSLFDSKGVRRSWGVTARLMAESTSKIFQKVFLHGFWGGAKRQLFENIKGITQGKVKLSGVTSGIGRALKKDMSENAPMLLGWGQRISKAFRFDKLGGTFLGRMIKDSIASLKVFKSLLGKTESGKAVLGIAKQFGKVAIAIGLVYVGIKLIIAGFKKMLDVGLKVEQTFLKMQIMLGSEKGAVKMIKQAKVYSAKTPYSAQMVGAGAAKMTGYGIKGPFEKGAGGLEKDVHAMQVAAGMALAGGKDLNHAISALMRGEVALLDEYTHARVKYNQMIKEGYKLGTEGFRVEFLRRVSQIPEYIKAAKIHSESVAGLWSTISSSTEDMWVAMTGAGRESAEIFNFWNAIRRILKEWAKSSVEFAAAVEPLMRELGAMIGMILEAIWNLGQALMAIFKPLIMLVGGALYGALWLIARVVNIIAWSIITLAKGIKIFANFVWSIFGKLFKWIDEKLGLSTKFSAMLDWIGKVIVSIQMAFAFLGVFLEKPLAAVKLLFTKIKELFAWISTKLDELFGKGSRLKALFDIGGEGKSFQELRKTKSAQIGKLRMMISKPEQREELMAGLRRGTSEATEALKKKGMGGLRTEIWENYLRQMKDMAKTAKNVSYDNRRSNSRVNNARTTNNFFGGNDIFNPFNMTGNPQEGNQ